MHVMSTLAVMSALREMTALPASFEFAPTAVLLQRIAAGMPADLAILTREAIASLAAEGAILPDSATDLVRSRVGIAVRRGTPHPDITTVDAFVATLHRARSIAYSRAGASGIFFAGLLQRLGLAEAINAKATIIPEGFTAELAADGSVDLAIQQISELMAVKGIEVVGPLPEAIGAEAVFSAGILRTAHEAPARQLLATLAGPEAARMFSQYGLTPVGTDRRRTTREVT